VVEFLSTPGPGPATKGFPLTYMKRVLSREREEAERETTLMASIVRLGGCCHPHRRMQTNTKEQRRRKSLRWHRHTRQDLTRTMGRPFLTRARPFHRRVPSCLPARFLFPLAAPSSAPCSEAFGSQQLTTVSSLLSRPPTPLTAFTVRNTLRRTVLQTSFKLDLSAGLHVGTHGFKVCRLEDGTRAVYTEYFCKRPTANVTACRLEIKRGKNLFREPPPPLEIIHVKYLRAGPVEMPFQNWYTAKSFRFDRFCKVEIQKTTLLNAKPSTA